MLDPSFDLSATRPLVNSTTQGTYKVCVNSPDPPTLSGYASDPWDHFILLIRRSISR